MVGSAPEGLAGRVLDRLTANQLKITLALLAGATAFVCALVFVEFTESVWAGQRAVTIDAQVMSWVLDHRIGALTAFMRLVTNLAGPPAVCLVVVAVVVTAWWLGRPRLALFMVSATAGAGLLVWVVKHVVGRSRPESADRLVGVTGAAFPSGHAAQSVACWVSLAVVVTWVMRNRFVTFAAPLLALAIALVVGGSRVYLGVHWPSDVIAGWSLGWAWVGSLLAAFAIWDALADRGALRGPPGSGPPAQVPQTRPQSGAGRLGEQ